MRSAFRYLIIVLAVVFSLVLVITAGSGLAAAHGPGQTQAAPQLFARFGHQVTGVAVSERGRVFVNFPRWTEDTPLSVAEVMRDGSLRPYPDAQWNAWRNVRRDQLSPADHWVCVQSVVADGSGNLWVVDPAAPGIDGIVRGGPKLVRIDLAANRVAQVIRFDDSVAIPGSYLNDVRFSNDGRYAFLTDSGQRGALVVVDLASGAARRVLDGHPSTQPEPGVLVRTDGRPLRYPDGRPVLFAADSIALSGDGYLYWKPLTGTTLYRISAAVLATRGLAGQDVADAVEPYGRVGPTDGFWIDALPGQGGNTLFVTSIEDNALKARDLGQGPAGGLRVVAQDPRMRWPDSLARGPDGALYVTTSRIQDSTFFRRDAPLALPTQLWRLRLPY